MRRAIGAPTAYDRGRTNIQLDTADWNVCELTVKGGEEAEYKLNGVVVNRVYEMEGNSGGWKPLTQGVLALQAEFAEVFYRNVRLKELP